MHAVSLSVNKTLKAEQQSVDGNQQKVITVKLVLNTRLMGRLES
jgi:hypothetical protein